MQLGGGAPTPNVLVAILLCDYAIVVDSVKKNRKARKGHAGIITHSASSMIREGALECQHLRNSYTRR
jgi:hypothetical protein